MLTSDQLASMFFETHKRGVVRLRELYDLGVLDRFRPYREGWGVSALPLRPRPGGRGYGGGLDGRGRRQGRTALPGRVRGGAGPSRRPGPAWP